jgi:hypothetical protein
MRIMRRPVNGYGMHNHQTIHITGGFPGRPCTAWSAAFTGMASTMSGPSFKGMDPSDPLTYVRPWNPQPGMIALLNYDGAAVQGTTPTQIQRGPQQRKIRRLRIGP